MSEKSNLQLRNLVASFKIPVKEKDMLSVESVSRSLNEYGLAKLDTQRGVKFKHSGGICTFLMKRGNSGWTVICTGTNSKRQIEIETEQLLKILHIELEELYIKIQNMTFTARLSDLTEKIDLSLLNIQMKNTRFNKDVFSGLIWRPEGKGKTAIVFSNAKIVIVGVKSFEEATHFLYNLKKEVRKILL
ncbi:MAG TPA: hypothetical protein ENH24_03940 [Nitrospirae bacterium]|nr:hypothetical protein [Nitrospirota bacterium]